MNPEPVPAIRKPDERDRASWPVVGGGGLVLGSLLELVEVLLFAWTSSRGIAEDWFMVNSILLVCAGVVVAIAAMSLALGGARWTVRRGIVGDSTTGATALICFAVAQLVAKVLTSLYFYIPDDRGRAGVAVSGLAVLVAFVAVIVAAVVVARAGVTHGPARWSLFAIVAVGPLTVVAVTLSSDLELVTNVLAVLVQAAVGITYLTQPAGRQRGRS